MKAKFSLSGREGDRALHVQQCGRKALLVVARICSVAIGECHQTSKDTCAISCGPRSECSLTNYGNAVSIVPTACAQ